MKLQNLYLALFFVLLTLFWYIFLPGSLWEIEANDFFSLSSDFLQTYLTSPQGLIIILSSFIAQFFKIKLAGALIMGIIPTLFIRTQIISLPAKMRSMNAWMPFLSGYLFAGLFAQGLSLQTGLQLVILSSLLAIYAILNNHFLRITAILVYILAAYSLFPPLLT
ncbi:MAG: DUF6057 family protein, partial [Bacteroidales bacterium]